jgi:anti-anti-sigma factor
VPSGRLRLRTDWHSATVVRISAAGEVDASNSDDFARYVLRFGANSRRLILDLADVEFLGVECFSVLDVIGDRCTTAAVAWTVIPSPAVARVLQICKPTSRSSAAWTDRKTPPESVIPDRPCGTVRPG